MVRKRLLFYCQHVLGIGHLIRSLAMIEALNEFEIFFLNGGERIAGIPFPPDITIIDLPALQTDEEFNHLQTMDQHHSLDDIQRMRRELILAEWERLQPDVIMIELFPFGRKRFASELIPLLARNRRAGSPSKVVCSLRDILVSKSNQDRHEGWVCHVINQYFDLILVHSDPTFQTLDETFARMNDLHCDVQYTGFVAQHCEVHQTSSEMDMLLGEEDSPLIVASIGGGRVGYELLECTIKAGLLLQSTCPLRMLILSGPNMPDHQFCQLQELVEGRSGMVFRRYTAAFLQYLQKADLSISMAGYNTCMNIVTSRVPAMVLPFTGRGNEEQTIRAKKLEQAGTLTVIEPHELDPETLGEKITHMLSRPGGQTRRQLDTNGAEKTAQLVDTVSRPSTGKRQKPKRGKWVETLSETLDLLQDTQKEIKIFLRDDDSDEDSEPLRHLLDISLSRHVPLSLAVIPGALTDSAIWLFKDHKRAAPTLLEIHQHGWLHINHEKEGRKCEFGPSRSYQQQWDDIAQGKAIMEQAFPMRFFPAFTPPWNRCTAETFKVLDDLRFHVLSKDQGNSRVRGYQFQEVSITLDLYRWKGGATMKEPEEIVNALRSQMREGNTVGLLLHHKIMNAEAFAFFDCLLQELTRSPQIRFHTLESLTTRIDEPIFTSS